MQEFQKELPDGFRNTLTTKVVLMTLAKDKKKKKKDKENSYSTGLIFSSVLLLLGTSQIDFEDLFDFELAAFLHHFLKNQESQGTQRISQSY